MAQGDSTVGICNRALTGALGQDPIVSVFPPDNTKRAILCSLHYDPVRREVLRSNPWRFARAQVNLAASATAPLFDWTNAYPLPADFIRMYNESSDQNDQPNFQVFGPTIFSNDGPPLGIVYIQDVQDPTRFDALFAKLLALELALVLCKPLTQSDELLAQVEAQVKDARAAAWLATSQEASPREWDEDIWLRARR